MAVTVDLVALTIRDDALCALAVRRGAEIVDAQRLVQRLRALNMFLADIYSEQQILMDGIVPRELVLALARVKQAAASVNKALGQLDAKKADAIVAETARLVEEAGRKVLTLEVDIRDLAAQQQLAVLGARTSG